MQQGRVQASVYAGLTAWFTGYGCLSSEDILTCKWLIKRILLKIIMRVIKV